MAFVRSHEKLEAWKVGIQLVLTVYQQTKSFPKEEMFGLVAQMRRSAVSVPSNIAEGAARQSTPAFIHFLHISRGSLSELETQIVISKELGYLKNHDELEALCNKVSALVAGLLKTLQR